MLAAALSVSACIPLADSQTAKAGQPLEIVFERSKAERPNWMSTATGQLFETGGELRMLTTRSRLTNLPLGLSQTEIAALDATRLAVAARVQTQLTDFTPSSSPLLKLRWQRMVLESTAKVAASTMKVRDIYYEGITREVADASDPIHQYFLVAVLVGLPKEAIPAIYQDLARRIASEPEADWQRLAAGLRQAMTLDSK